MDNTKQANVKFRAKMSIARIKAAFAHILKVRNLRDTTGINQIVFVKQGFMAGVQETLRTISFSDKDYEVIYDFVNNRKFDGISVVTEDLFPNMKFWHIFDDFCAMILAFPSTIEDEAEPMYGQIGYASFGHNLILLYFNNPSDVQFGKTAMFAHDCELDASMYTDLINIDAEKPEDYQSYRRRVVEVPYDGQWTCSTCGGSVLSALINLRELWGVVK